MLGVRRKGVHVNYFCEEDIHSKIHISEAGCWIWMGTITKDGVGQMSRGPKKFKAHRVAYEVFIGEIAEGLVVNRKCKDKLCVNPAHLELVTPQELIKLYDNAGTRNASKTHCPKGHPYVDGKRRCRECAAEYIRNYRTRTSERSDPTRAPGHSGRVEEDQHPAGAAGGGGEELR